MSATNRKEGTIAVNMRYRLVTITVAPDQQTEEHVSSVILTAAEAWESVTLEAELAARAGWDVRTLPDLDGHPPTYAMSRNNVARYIKAQPSTAFTDLLTS